MSLLTIVSDACARMSLVQPVSVVGSSDRQVQQLLALTNQAGRELARAATWQALLEEQTFTTVAAEQQPDALPDDFDRFVPDSFFNRSTRRAVTGPITPDQWQAIKAYPYLSTVYLLWRKRQGAFLMTPNPPAGQTIAYEYVSRNWAESTNAVLQPAFAADTDTALLDESLITDSLVWRFLQAKGLAYAETMATFERNLELASARDRGSRRLTLTPRPFDMDRVNLPDGDYPGRA